MSEGIGAAFIAVVIFWLLLAAYPTVRPPRIALVTIALTILMEVLAFMVGR